MSSISLLRQFDVVMLSIFGRGRIAFPEVSRRTDGDFAASSFLGLLF